MNQGKRKTQSRGYIKMLIWLGWLFLIGMIIAICASCKTMDQQVSYPNPECERQAKMELAQYILLSPKFDLSREERTALDSITYFNYIKK